MKIKKAIIPVAGLGTRFLPATKAQPKEMLPIVDKPAIQYIIEEAVKAGIEDILLITSRNKKTIEDHFDLNLELEMKLKQKGEEKLLTAMKNISNLANIHYIRQKEPRGLGHAIYCGKSFIKNEPFAVLLGDDIVFSPLVPCVSQLIEVFKRYNSTIIGVQKVPSNDVNKYGIVQGNRIEEKLYNLESLVEKPEIEQAPSNIAILGRYILTPEIFNILEHTKEGSGGEIQLTDALNTLCKKQDVYAYEFEGLRYDVGSKLGFLKATVEFALRNKKLEKDFREYLNTFIKNNFCH
ncbi:UTP--glucose-1-phosphate uridylyltransferase GalU [Clostridiaceae bacterium M8S5]|nr:UTP--glucose-1-phosphate uridylyltransferase GalU [Clostridiaceae bacterium M8S5]